MTGALIVIDMLNPYEHEDADGLMRSVKQIIAPLSQLFDRSRSTGIFSVYVNDNHGDWTAGPKELARRALEGRAPELVRPVLPPSDTPFVVKARHSIFYETLLEYLLHRRQVERIALTGQVTEQCVLYSALDAYVRHFEVVVPRDCVAHIHEDLAHAALQMMERNMSAQIVDGGDQALAVLAS